MGLAFLQGLFPSSEVYGSKPKAVQVKDAEAILKESSLANLANVENVNKLASKENEFNLDEVLRQFETVAPGVFPKLIENIGAQSRGELSPDSVSEVWRGAAARGVDSGTGGSDFNRNLGLRDLGLRSTSEQQRGQTNFQSLMKSVLPNLFDPASQLLRPQDVQNQRNLAFSNELYNAKIRAAPDPAKAGAAAAQVALMESLQGSYTGNTNFSNQYQNPFSSGASVDNMGLYDQPQYSTVSGSLGLPALAMEPVLILNESRN